MPVVAGPGNQASCLSVVVVGWKGSYHHQWARSPVGPGQGGTAGGGWVGGRASDPGLSSRPALSVTMRALGGSGDGDDAAVVQPVVIGAEQHQVVQLGGAAVFPVPEVVGVQTAGGPTAGNRAHGVAVFERAAQPPVDQPGRPAGTDDLAVRVRTRLRRWHHRSGSGVRRR